MLSLKPQEEVGASAVEYSFLVAGIAAILVVVVFAVGAFTGALFTDTCNELDAAYTSVSGC